jgi:hypothetical protein
MIRRRCGFINSAFKCPIKNIYKAVVETFLSVRQIALEAVIIMAARTPDA